MSSAIARYFLLSLDVDPSEEEDVSHVCCCLSKLVHSYSLSSRLLSPRDGIVLLQDLSNYALRLSLVLFSDNCMLLPRR